jgi:hypothetical protein
MPVQRYVIVSEDLANKVITDGPCLWDGGPQWAPPAGTIAILEADALSQGYSWPPPEGSGE